MHDNDVPPERLLSIASWAVTHQSDRFGSAAKAMQIAIDCGASRQQAWQIGTAVAELASNAVRHGGGGHVKLLLESSHRLALHVLVTDQGDGFPVVEREPSTDRWAYRRAGQGLGLGLDGVHRLMNEVHIDSRPGAGATVTAIKIIGDRHKPGSG